MNPIDLSNALLYGIPVVMYAGMYTGIDNLLTRRDRSAHAEAVINPIDVNAALHISVAKSPEQFATARELVRQRYAWRGYKCEDPTSASAELKVAPSPQEFTF